MKCPNCKFSLELKHSFCPNCGFDLRNVIIKETLPKQKANLSAENFELEPQKGKKLSNNTRWVVIISARLILLTIWSMNTVYSMGYKSFHAGTFFSQFVLVFLFTFIIDLIIWGLFFYNFKKGKLTKDAYISRCLRAEVRLAYFLYIPIILLGLNAIDISRKYG